MKNVPETPDFSTKQIAATVLVASTSILIFDKYTFSFQIPNVGGNISAQQLQKTLNLSNPILPQPNANKPQQPMLQNSELMQIIQQVQ